MLVLVVSLALVVLVDVVVAAADVLVFDVIVVPCTDKHSCFTLDCDVEISPLFSDEPIPVNKWCVCMSLGFTEYDDVGTVDAMLDGVV